ncbi:copper ABC transporter ATP-binding protein [Massilia sp. Root418]|jgi:Cu-processing system ATP-binding protein|uniref:ABC transporter ATP-binding protein n=1 Tax=Massilia sp. Root418 TaxID=1736532 RepID=UPI0006FF6002|nr:ABC transporter ATP-binding protein [Massilia sp. Root418]KQW93572.1 copper ABC transporter ATP-binding protein [Massilia sp. Root418]
MRYSPDNDADPVQLQDVRRRYGTVQALDGVSLNVRRGELFGLIGHNGAGKSTLFKMMLGLIQPSGGLLRVLGTDTRSAAFRQARTRIGYLPENFVTYENLSGLEVLYLFADLKKAPRKSCGALLERVGLGSAASRRVHGYSKGMRQRLGLAQALLGEPRLLFLDEPTSGLDPAGIADFYGILHQLRGDGATIVITSHILAEIQQRVDRLAILQDGRLAALGTLGELRASQPLPLRIDATLHCGLPASALDALRALGMTLTVEEGEGTGRAAIACPPERKMQLLAALAPLASALDIHEPTLEQLFLGYGGAHGHAH